MSSARIQTQHGVGLIEVLVTLLLLSVGLLGMAALQARAQQAEMESYQRAQALILLEDMANRMTANRIQRNDYVGITIGQGLANYAGGANSPAKEDIEDWQRLLRGAAEGGVGAMIGARGCILSLGNERYEITIAWQGLSPTAAIAANACGQGNYGDDALRRVVTRTLRFAILN